MKARWTMIALLLGLVSRPSAGAAEKGAETRRSTVTNPFITGSFADAANGQGVFSGNLKLAPFDLQGGLVVAIGELKGVLSDSTGAALGRVDLTIVWPVESIQGTCQALQLKLATLDMTLMEMGVHFDPVVLDVISMKQRDKGARDLICSIAQRAQSEPAAADLTTKLNDLFRALP